MIFSRFFTLLSLSFLSLFFFVSLGLAGTQESLHYILDKENIEIDRNSLSERSLMYLYKKSQPEYLSDLFVLESKNLTFIFNKILFTKTFSKTSQNIAFLKDLDNYITTDIWSLLDSSNNREKTTDEYIELGTLLLQSADSEIESFSSQEKGIKKEISHIQKNLSQLKKKYKKNLTTWDSQELENIELEITELSQQLTKRELYYEKIKIYKKRLISSEKNIKNRLIGAKENRDALIKNVKVKGNSGKFIDAIE